MTIPDSLPGDFATAVSGFPADPVIERLRKASGVQRVPNARISLFMKRDFLNAGECAALTARIDAERRPSTIADAGGDRYFRTSETCDLRAEEPLARLVVTRLGALTGIDPVFGEPLQGQRYAVGQEFKQHTDYFDPLGADYDRYCRLSGQRTWTAMIYLNVPEAGGATRFGVIDKIIRPETGKLVLWDNRRADGSGNAATLHQGMKVRAGTKYVLTQWYRERPWQWD